MKTLLAFDVYGTLIDTAGVVSELRELMGATAEDFSRTWREKRLDYAFDTDSCAAERRVGTPAES